MAIAISFFLFLLCRGDHARLFEYRTLIKNRLMEVTIRIKVDLGNSEIVITINKKIRSGRLQ